MPAKTGVAPEPTDHPPTPYFSFDLEQVTTAWHGLAESFATRRVAPLVAYAMKVNPLHDVVSHLAGLGAGAEVVSRRELRAALDSGIPGDRIVVNGAVKSPDYLAEAISAGARVNVETPRQLETVAVLTRGLSRRPMLGIRLAADVPAPSRFGVPLTQLEPLLDRCAAMDLTVQGLHVHHSPGVDGADPVQWRVRAEAVERAVDLGHPALDLRWVDWGGGLRSPSGRAPDVAAYADAAGVAADLIAGQAARFGAGVTHIVEPGRFLVEHAGALHLTCVDLLPRPGGPLVVVLDAGVGLLSAYDCWLGEVRFEGDRPVDRPVECLVTGPSAMEEDVIVRTLLPRVPAVGDRVTLTRVGAYHHAGANTFFHDPPSVYFGRGYAGDGVGG